MSHTDKESRQTNPLVDRKTADVVNRLARALALQAVVTVVRLCSEIEHREVFYFYLSRNHGRRPPENPTHGPGPPKGATHGPHPLADDLAIPQPVDLDTFLTHSRDAGLHINLSLFPVTRTVHY